MAYAVPSRLHALLTDLAQPLLEKALAEAAQLVLIQDGADEPTIARSVRVQAVTLAFQALLRTPAIDAISEFELIVALATVCGTVMAQVHEPGQLYRVFQTQFAAVLQEVGEAAGQGVQ